MHLPNFHIPQEINYLPNQKRIFVIFCRIDWDRWLMMGMIGLCVGIIGFFLHNFIALISEFKWSKAHEFLQVRHSLHLK